MKSKGKRSIAPLLMIALIVGTMLFLSACSDSLDGTWVPAQAGAGFQSVTFDGNRISIPPITIMGDTPGTGINITYVISDGELIVTQSAMGVDIEISRFSFRRDGNSIFLNDVEYVREGQQRIAVSPVDEGHGTALAVVAEKDITPTDTTELPENQSQGHNESDIGNNEAVSEAYVAVINLNLPLTIRETTYRIHTGWGGTTWRITMDGILQRYVAGAWNRPSEWMDIDTDVRSLYSLHNNVTFYIKNDNTLWGFGSNTQGLLGDGTGVDRSEPVLILNDVATVNLYNTIFYAITTDKRLVTWGGGNFEPVYVASNIIGFFNNLSQIVHSTDGNIHQIGCDHSLTQFSQEPIFQGLIRSSWGVISLAYHINSTHSLIRRQQVEGGRWIEYVEIASYVSDIFELANQNIFFIRQDGTLWGMGTNRDGELGDGTRVPRNEPVQIAENVAHAGNNFFLTRDNALWIWNSNYPTPRQVAENIEVLVDGAYARFHEGGQIIPRNSWVNAGLAVERGEEFMRGAIFDNVKTPRILTFD